MGADGLVVPTKLTDTGLELASLLEADDRLAEQVIALAHTPTEEPLRYLLMEALGHYAIGDLSRVRYEATEALLHVYFATSDPVVRANALGRLGRSGDVDSTLIAVQDYVANSQPGDSLIAALIGMDSLIGFEKNRSEIARNHPEVSVVSVDNSCEKIRAMIEQIERDFPLQPDEVARITKLRRRCD